MNKNLPQCKYIVIISNGISKLCLCLSNRKNITLPKIITFQMTNNYKIPVIYGDEDFYTQSLTEIIAKYEPKHRNKGGFILAKDPTIGFKIGASVLDMTISYQTQFRRAVRKDMYELSTSPSQECTVNEWLHQEVIDYFGDVTNHDKVSNHFWNTMLPNGTFHSANYSNGNNVSLFPGELFNFHVKMLYFYLLRKMLCF